MYRYIKAPIGESVKMAQINIWHEQELKGCPIRKCIELIGRMCDGIGSNYAKGKRYIRGKYGISGRAIKHMHRIYPKWKPEENAVVVEYPYGIYFFVLHKKSNQILMCIIDEISSPKLVSQVSGIFAGHKHGERYVDILFSQQEVSLRYTSIYMRGEDKEFARELCKNLDLIKLKY